MTSNQETTWEGAWLARWPQVSVDETPSGATVELSVQSGSGQTIDTVLTGDRLRCAVVAAALPQATRLNRPVRLDVFNTDGHEVFAVLPNGVVAPTNQGVVVDTAGLTMLQAACAYCTSTTPVGRECVQCGQAFPHPLEDVPKPLGIQASPATRIMVANLKGGAGKTPLAVLLASALAEQHRDQVVLLEVNPRGTLASRTVSSPHKGTILELAALTQTRQVLARDLETFLHPQPFEWATLCCPASILDTDGEVINLLTEQDVANVSGTVASRARLQIFDTGNSDLDSAWRGAAALANHLVVPVQWDRDSMRMAQRMLQDLADSGLEALVRSATIVGTRPRHPRPDKRLERDYRRFWDRHGYLVVDIPSDPHLESRGLIEWAKLRHSTRKAARSLAEHLVEPPANTGLVALLGA